MMMSNRSAIAPARSMIEVISLSVGEGLAERNAWMAKGYVTSLLDCSLIDQAQFDALNEQAETALRAWRPKSILSTL
jgi:hypothetical protein